MKAWTQQLNTLQETQRSCQQRQTMLQEELKMGEKTLQTLNAELQIIQTRVHHPLFQSLDLPLELLQLCESYLDFECCPHCISLYAKGFQCIFCCDSVSLKNLPMEFDFFWQERDFTPYWTNIEHQTRWDYILQQMKQRGFQIVKDTSSSQDHIWEERPIEMQIYFTDFHFKDPQFRIQFGFSQQIFNGPDKNKYRFIPLRTYIAKQNKRLIRQCNKQCNKPTRDTKRQRR